MSKPDLEFDHIVVTCHKLSAGVEYIRRVFGVEIPPGGQHDFMGTHNALMAVGDGIYFEVIAIDPSLMVPSTPRWFGLGNPMIEDRMKDPVHGGPILMHYVLRTTDMDATLAGLDPELRKSLGRVHEASRGDLSWKITINEAGLPAEGGCLPALIEWHSTPPQYQMARPGPVFERIHLCHPKPKAILNDLIAMGGNALIEGGMIEVQDTENKGLKADFTHRGKKVWI